MKTTLSTTQATDLLMEFEAFGTGSDAYTLCYHMVHYLEQFEDETGEEIDLDPVAIRYEYRVITLDEAVSDYQIPPHFDGHEGVLQWLQDRTEVIETDFKNTYIIQEF